MKDNLDPYEKEILEYFEKGQWQPVPNNSEQMRQLREAAKNSFKKDSRVNIRLSQRDVAAVKTKALEEGLPYQTLLSSVIHKFVTGRLIERHT